MTIEMQDNFPKRECLLALRPDQTIEACCIYDTRIAKINRRRIRSGSDCSDRERAQSIALEAHYQVPPHSLSYCESIGRVVLLFSIWL